MKIIDCITDDIEVASSCSRFAVVSKRPDSKKPYIEEFTKDIDEAKEFIMQIDDMMGEEFEIMLVNWILS